MLQGFHSNWTRPFFARRPQEGYWIEPFELLTTALSALTFRRENGTISMLCDSVAAAYYEENGLSFLWDGGVHAVLDTIGDEIDPICFWAAGKLYALREMAEQPCVMIDTDFIVWRSLAPLLEQHPLAVIHREELNPEIYPDPSVFHLHRPFSLAWLDRTVLAANTALSWFGEPAFTRLYTNTAIDFMQAASPADHALTYMVFAEQRLLAMLAAREGVPLTAFSELSDLFLSGQNWFTHVWGFKDQMRRDPAAYDAFCRRCARRLSADFPEAAQRLRDCPPIAQYFEPSCF